MTTIILMDQILCLFHHIHHKGDAHEVHHCGGDHKGLDYTIRHCGCGMHNVDKQSAVGHDFYNNEVTVEFLDQCPEGGWHVESGKMING